MIEDQGEWGGGGGRFSCIGGPGVFGIRQIHWPLSFYQQYRWKKKERSVSGKKNKFVRSGVGQNGDIHTHNISISRGREGKRRLWVV